jgi:hypothetical protein
MLPPTSRVTTLKTAWLCPGGTVTVGGTKTGSAASNETTAPPAGAGPVRTIVPESGSPPTTDGALMVSDTSEVVRETVNVALRALLAPTVAEIVAEPAARADAVKVAVRAPAGMLTVEGTVATAALLDDIMTVTPLAGATSASVMVPCTVLPGRTVEAFSERSDNVADDIGVDGAVGDDDELQAASIMLSTTVAVATSVAFNE